MLVKRLVNAGSSGGPAIRTKSAGHDVGRFLILGLEEVRIDVQRRRSVGMTKYTSHGARVHVI